MFALLRLSCNCKSSTTRKIKPTGPLSRHSFVTATSASNWKKLRENDDFIVIKLVCLARGNGWGGINNRWNGVDTVWNEGIFNVHCEQVSTPLWNNYGKLKLWETLVSALTAYSVLKILVRTISAYFRRDHNKQASWLFHI